MPLLYFPLKGAIKELQRRNVFRVALTYAVAAWIVAQVAGLAADAFAAPSWVMQMIIVALIIGFLPAVVVAWAFELTPEGIRRERDLVDRETVNRCTARQLDIAVIFLLVLAIGLVVGDRFLARPAPVGVEAITAQATANPSWTLDSIAVLPFADFSPARDQAWLGEGIADTLLHVLAQVEGLSVSVLDLDRDNALVWAARGHLLQELGLEADGLDALHRAERPDPGNANIQVWVGNRHFAVGRLALIVQAESRRDAMRERLRAEAPAGLLM